MKVGVARRKIALLILLRNKIFQAHTSVEDDSQKKLSFISERALRINRGSLELPSHNLSFVNRPWKISLHIPAVFNLCSFAD